MVDTKIYLNIGSNNGERRDNISRALAACCSHWSQATIRTSAEYHSKPWGFVSDKEFINVGVEISMQRSEAWTQADLENLLQEVLMIQNAINKHPHRTPEGGYADRELDIDIIAVDMIEYSSATLTLPHPRAALRDFVMIPMAELASEQIMNFLRDKAVDKG